jgi:hypothetical protein
MRAKSREVPHHANLTWDIADGGRPVYRGAGIGDSKRKSPLMAIQTYEGGCHCGPIRDHDRSFTHDRVQLLDLQQERLSASSRSAERFRLISGAEDLETYEFGTRVARHLFCRRCGVASSYRP